MCLVLVIVLVLVLVATAHQANKYANPKLNVSADLRLCKKDLFFAFVFWDVCTASYYFAHSDLIPDSG